MDEKALALRLADALASPLEDANNFADYAAAELRRLHAVNAELTENLEKKSSAIQRIWKERDELRQVNAELLEALKYHQEQTRPIERTRAAIEAALKEKNHD